MLKIKVDRGTFLKAIQIVEKAVRDNKIRPVISGIELEAKGKRISLKGTDLELTIKNVIEGTIMEDGKIVFSHQMVEEYLKEIPDDEIFLEEKEGKLLLTSANSISEFSIYDADEYPHIRSLETGKECFINKEIFLDLLEKARVAAAQTPDNLAVNCVRVEIENRKLSVIASDTYRMVYSEAELGEEAGNEIIKASIPLKTIDSMIKILKAIEGNTTNLRYEGSQIFFTIGDVSILSRVIDLEFPDYDAILTNTTYDKEVFLNKKDFISVLKRVLVFVKNNTEAKNSGIFTFMGNKLMIRGISEAAKVKEEIETIKTGEDLTISLNVKFLLDYLQNLETENVAMSLSNSSSAVLLKGEKREDFIYFTMPLALNEE